MMVLCLNCGSSSVKYRLYDWDNRKTLASGAVERVGISGTFCEQEAPGKSKVKVARDCANHKEAIQLAIETITHKELGVIQDLSLITAVGHRVLHGGEKVIHSVVITPEMIKTFEDLSDLGPLHNPSNVMGIKAAQALMPGIKHMAIMDTAWHQTMPDYAYMYALPYEWYTKYGIRRYGFHGTSLLYTAKRAAVLLDKNPFECNLITCHIGNGVSVNAVKKGVSFDTSMGLTPQEGVMMGTRAGDHDVAIDFYMMQKENISPKEMDSILNKKSGLFGVTGRSSDMRDIQAAVEEKDPKAILALEIYGYRLKKYLGAYSFGLGKVDAIVFTAGIGEMSAIVRAKALDGLEEFGIIYDKEKNKNARTRNCESDISAPDSKVKIFVIPTDEERVFIEDVVHLMNGTYDLHTRFTYRFQGKDYVNTLRCLEFAEELKKNPVRFNIMAEVFKKAFFQEAQNNPALKQKIKDIPELGKQAAFMPPSLRSELGF